MRVHGSLAALALAAWLAGSPAARASHCGACAYPDGCCAAPAPFCPPTVRHRVCYQTVWEDKVCVRYKAVPHTVMKECRYTVMEPCYEQHVRTHKYCVSKPVWESYDVVQKYTVCKPVYEQHVRTQTYCVMKPIWTEYQVPVQWTTFKPVYEQHVRTHTYCVMKPCWQEYQVPVQWTTFHPVYEQHVRIQKYCVQKPVW